MRTSPLSGSLSILALTAWANGRRSSSSNSMSDELKSSISAAIDEEGNETSTSGMTKKKMNVQMLGAKEDNCKIPKRARELGQSVHVYLRGYRV